MGLRALSIASDVVLGVSCHPKLDTIATAGNDKDLRNIRIWELEQGSLTQGVTQAAAVPATAGDSTA